MHVSVIAIIAATLALSGCVQPLFYGRVAAISEGRATIITTAEGLRDSLQLIVTHR